MKTNKLLSLEKELIIVPTKAKYILPDKLQKRVDHYWDALIKKGNKYTRGVVFSISDIKENKKKIRIDLDKTDYAHYLYTRKIGLSKKYACKNLHTSCLIETSDEILVIGKMGKNTSMPGNIQCIGGGLDNGDINGNKIDLEHNIKKELLEEIGIKVEDKKLVKNLGLKYLLYSTEVNSIAAIFLLRLKMTAQEFASLYSKFEKHLEKKYLLPEFDELLYLSKNKSAINIFYKKEKSHFDHYLKPLLDEVAN